MDGVWTSAEPSLFFPQLAATRQAVLGGRVTTIGNQAV
jgi:hypothetical protein